MGWILGQEDPLEEGMATHSGIVAREIPWTEGPVYTLWGCTELDTTERHTHTYVYIHRFIYICITDSICCIVGINEIL